MSQLLSLNHKLGPITVSSFTYTYDQVGSRDTLTTNRSGIPNAQTALSYVYDDLNRLTQATRPLTGETNETFQYDPVGNRLQRDGDTVDNTFDDGNRLLEDASFTYTYDLNGNLTQKIRKSSGEVTVYTWDAEDQLIMMEVKPDLISAPINTTNYKYDAIGRRIQKDVDGVVTAYIYDSSSILLEFNGINVLEANYVHTGLIDEPLQMIRNGINYYYHNDGLKNVTELSDDVGSVNQSYTYNSYGNLRIFNELGMEINPSSAIKNPFTYTSREFDPETGFHYYRSRYYDSSIGQFINEDPIGFTGEDINLYRYVFNNPMNFVDPLGFIAEKTSETEIKKQERQRKFDEMLKKGKKDPTKGTKSETRQPKPRPKIPKQGKRAFCGKLLEQCFKGATRCPVLPGKIAIGAACIAGFLICVTL